MAEKASVGPGRPRSPQIDHAVLRATRQLLLEVGYSGLSYELIAQRARVSRPALYRRWATKAHLVHDAVFPHRGHDLELGSGSFAEDLRGMIARTFASYGRPEVRIAVPGLLTDLDEPSRRHSVLDRLQQPVRQHLADRVALGVARGEIRSDVDSDVLLDTVVGALFQRVIAQGDLDPRFADQLADLLLDGLRARPP